jgi:hypothetical protein
MKRSLSTVLFLLICLFSLIGEVHGLPWPPTISVYSISFNYESGYTYDALRIKKNNSTYVPVPEWLTGNRNEKIAYIKSQSNRKVKVQFYIEPSGYSNSNISVLADVSGEGIGYINSNKVYFQGSQYSTPKVMTCQGSVPGSANIKNFSWSWYAAAVNGTVLEDPLWIGVTGAHVYYILLSAPQSPMAEPWTSVLDYACVWASGQSNNSGTAQKVTEGIYYQLGDLDGDLDYDWPLGRCIYSKGSSNRTFELTNFLTALNSSGSVIVNCSDCGNLVNIFTAAVGISTQSKRIGNPNTFTTKSINPIGSPGWNSTSWGYHQYGWIGNQVCDGCIEVNYGVPILPTNMIQSTYDSYLLAPGQSYTWSDTGNASVE